jgi:pilus assembly protein CpaE
VLGLDPPKTVHDLVAAPGELDSDKLAGYTVRHASGIDLLAAPLRPEEAELVPVAKIVRLLEVARETYDVTVIDTAPFLHGPILASIDHADDLLLLAALDVPTLKDVRQSLETLSLISFPTERISMVLNRADANAGLSRAEVEEALGVRFRFALPGDQAVPLGVNRGNPVVLSDSRSPFAHAVRQLASTLAAARRAAPALHAVRA